MPVAGVTTLPTYNYTVNGTNPAWFYCKTGLHCKAGMVFAVNPTVEQNYDAFKANAVNGTASAAPSGSAPGSTTSAAATSTSSSTSYGSVSSLILEPSITSIVNNASSTYGKFHEFISSNSNQYLLQIEQKYWSDRWRGGGRRHCPHAWYRAPLVLQISWPENLAEQTSDPAARPQSHGIRCTP